MATVEEKLGYKFKNKDYLMQALTHSSFAYQKKLQSNERLEFLGDSVLSFTTANFLYHTFPDMSEGDLTQLRSSLVRTETLAGFAKELSLGDYLFLGKGEVVSGGAERPSILEDAFEAMVAAIYLDGGIEAARAFILRFIEPIVAEHHEVIVDYKTKLQEVMQQNRDQRVNYVITGFTGPDHAKVFDAEVHLNSNVIGRGKGRSKKMAEQEAAKDALSLMGICDEKG